MLLSMYINLLLALCCEAVVIANVEHVIYERSDLALRGWVKRDEPNPDTLVPVRIALVQSNLEKGHDILMSISDPQSTEYGKHWTQKAIDDLFRPSQESITAVRCWLESAGMVGDDILLSSNRYWMTFHASISQLEGLLRAKYNSYEHARTGEKSFGCDSYSVPRHVRRHIDFIHPSIPHTGRLKRTSFVKRSTELAARDISTKKPLYGDQNCPEYFTPPCYRDLYGITEGAAAQKGNEMGLYETYADAFVESDLDGFSKYFEPRIPPGTYPTVNSVDGGKSPIKNLNNAGFESTLDLDIAYPIIYPQKMTVFQVNDNYYTGLNSAKSPSGIFNPFLDAIDGEYCNYTAYGETGDNPKYDPVYPDKHKGGYNHPRQCGLYKPTNVISISYGVNEVDLPVNYQRRQCNEWMKLGMQGISVFVASGDDGVSGGYSKKLNGNGCLGSKAQIFGPSSPNNCPYITSVGATQLVSLSNDSTYGGEEIATKAFGSGGGFSNIFETPNYQRDAVNVYLTKYPPPYKSYSTTLNQSVGAGGGVFNRNGRAFPDVSAVGYNNLIYVGDQPLQLGGSSAAAPAWAAIITRINDARLAAGKSTVGFVNPVLYKNADLMNDIVEGNNPGCGTKGFSAAPGWDPVTGMGTPDFPKLLKMFMALP